MDVVFEQYFDFKLMGDNFGFVLEGFWETVQLSLVSGILALVWGLVLALLRQLPGRRAAPVRWLTIAYIDAFRGVPLLLVVLIISGSAPFVAEGIGLPPSVGIPQWFGKPDPFWYGTFAITLTYGAYMAEVYRSGIEGVPRGQMEAARALGMSHGRAMRHVIVPQAVRRVIPPLLNDFIALMKDTSLVGVIALLEVVEAGRT
ncbi:MAG: polar amino acid transport system permease protein, partial [Thermoleophilaceae bacterium]|nr:polar amino acid transport system permease protein [Thermoleophilaceae bacterium]